MFAFRESDEIQLGMAMLDRLHALLRFSTSTTLALLPAFIAIPRIGGGTKYGGVAA